MEIKRLIFSIIAMWTVATVYPQLYFSDIYIFKDRFPEVTEETEDYAYEAPAQEIVGEWIGLSISYKFNADGTGECISLGGFKRN